MRQPEALRLAAQLEDTESARLHLLFYAAAEMRGLYDENAPLREANMAWAASKELRRLYDENQRLHAQRDALLEKIKAVIAAEQSEGAGRGGFINTPPTREHQRRVAQAWQELHAAIAKAEGEET